MRKSSLSIWLPQENTKAYEYVGDAVVWVNEQGQADDYTLSAIRPLTFLEEEAVNNYVFDYNFNEKDPDSSA